MGRGREKLKNEYAWSLSRARLYERCAREYWWNYFGAWEGWEQSADAITKLAYRVKRLESRWSLPGKIVHDALDTWLRRVKQGSGPAADGRLEDEAVQMLRDAYRSSLRGDYLRSKAYGLVEHYNDLDVDDAQWRQMAETVKTALRNFLGSPMPEFLRGEAHNTLQIDKFAQFELAGVRVFAIPDLLLRWALPQEFTTGDGEVWRVRGMVIDWKVGRQRDEHRQQLVLYGMFADSTKGMRPDDTLGSDEYLTECTTSRIHLGSSDAATARDDLLVRIGADAKKIRALMDTPETAPRENFPETTDAWKCVSCRFRRICKPQLSERRPPEQEMATAGDTDTEG